MPHQVAEGEGALAMRPLDAVGGDERRDADRARADVLEVGKEGVRAVDLHGRYGNPFPYFLNQLIKYSWVRMKFDGFELVP